MNAARAASLAITALSHPLQTATDVVGRLSPATLIHRQIRLARALGLKRLYLTLSFDCDTEDDIGVAWDVHERCRQLGVLPSYAVPGELLAQGQEVYGRIAATGAEFINHGGRSHVYFDHQADCYASNFFYDQQSPDTLIEDIRQGDQTVRDVLGTPPRGFRVPHFGTFQRPAHLKFLHRQLTSLGYAFSSSTTPWYALCHGPLVRREGLVELPVTGMISRPLSVLDSWTCFAAPDRTRCPDDYGREAAEIARRFAGHPGYINIYADPSHIAGKDVFFQALAQLRAIANPVSFSGFLAETVTDQGPNVE